MWLFQRDDTLDEDEDECGFVLAAEEGAGAKYLVMRGEGAETGAEAARGGCWPRRGGGRLNMSRINSRVQIHARNLSFDAKSPFRSSREHHEFHPIWKLQSRR